MKHFFTSFALTLGLALPLLAACGGSTTDAPGTDGTNSGASTAEPGQPVDSSATSGQQQTCASVGGTCVGLAPASCVGGHWADGSKVSCGGGLGVGCCILCPAIALPPADFCPGGNIVPRKNANGCDSGFDCVKTNPLDCPQIALPPASFCPDGTLVMRKNPNTGCDAGFDCVPPSTNACTAAGGTCVGIAPSSCASDHWGDASTHSCGGGVGVGCCLP